jgi:mono/diheme cytochrome c family protein
MVGDSASRAGRIHSKTSAPAVTSLTRKARGAGAYPSLAADGKLASTEFLLSALLGGLNGMPPVGGMMSDAQVADVVNYVRGHFGNSYSNAISAADVAVARRQGTAR